MKVSTVGELRARLAGLSDSDLVAVDLWRMADLRPYVRRAAESLNIAASLGFCGDEPKDCSARDLLGCIPAGDWEASEDELTERLVDALVDLLAEGGAA